MPSHDLSGTWLLRGINGLRGFKSDCLKEEIDRRLYINADVPGEVHLDLLAAGRIADPYHRLNHLACRWVEDQVWIFRRTFTADHALDAAQVQLIFERLDGPAVIHLNGQEVGRHANSFRPCRIDVTGKLRQGQNLLIVELESGLHHVAELEVGGFDVGLESQLSKRHWLRQPQCSFGWDWTTRLLNIGISAPVRLEWFDTAAIAEVALLSEVPDTLDRATLRVRVWIDAARQGDALLQVKLPDAKLTQQKTIQLTPGSHLHELTVAVPNPRLWYPRTHGRQPLYNVEIELSADGKMLDTAARRTGFRRVVVDQSPHPDGGQYFRFIINGQCVFLKGANWIPADMIFCRSAGDRARKLVALAEQANFNFLRIWGGGLYESEDFYNACDQAGIVVWQEFIFSCGKYPATDKKFVDEVRTEATHQVRRLSPHPSLVIWCGNNEQEWGAWDWGFAHTDQALTDHGLYHVILPQIVAAEDPTRFYWPSSPYSGPDRHPNAFEIGDQHPWQVCMGPDGPNFFAYRDMDPRMPNEGGVLGVPNTAVLDECLPDDQRHLQSFAWCEHANGHDSAFAVQPKTERIVRHWTGLDPQQMPLETFAYYSGLLQAEGLTEYANAFRRRMHSTSAAAFWMYNDCWPTTTSWTVVDYRLRRNLAYHPVRRAFADCRAIVAPDGDGLAIVGVNDTLTPRPAQLRYGLFALAGGLPVDITESVELPANSAAVLARLDAKTIAALHDGSCGAFTLLIDENGNTIDQSRIFLTPFKDLSFAKPEVQVDCRHAQATFTSNVFCWGLCLDLTGQADLSDNLFDLLPGIAYRLPCPADKPPKVIRCGNLP